MFYDAVEDVEEMSSDEEAFSKPSKDPRIEALRTKLTSITRRRAKIRNVKVNSLNLCIYHTKPENLHTFYTIVSYWFKYKYILVYEDIDASMAFVLFLLGFPREEVQVKSSEEER